MQVDGVEIDAKSYSHYFFDKWNLKSYLNDTCSSMFQIGASCGEFLKIYKDQNWSVNGYDYSETAVIAAKEADINLQQIDLNAINSFNQSLSYKQQLLRDLSAPTNFIAVRVLQYLDVKALALLLQTVQDNIHTNSVIVIVNSIAVKDTLTLEDRLLSDVSFKDESGIKDRNYLFSFFAPRTDFAVLLHTTSDATVAPKKDDHIDEVIVVKKTV